MRKDESPGTPVSPNLLAQMGYETRDVILRPLVMSLLALLVFIVVSLVSMFFLYQAFIPNWAKVGQPVTPPAARRLPPHPQIQAEPKQDMAIFRIAEDGVVSGNAPDSTGARQTMRIEEAIDVMATQRGIAGITGTEVRDRGDSGPGQRTANRAAAEPSKPAPGGTGTPAGATQEGHSGGTGGH
jgi:hypothetical protein